MTSYIKLNLNGEYESIGMRLKKFKTKNGELKKLTGTLTVDDNIPNGKFIVDIIMNPNKRNENAPDANMTFTKVVEDGWDTSIKKEKEKDPDHDLAVDSDLPFN